MMPREKKIEKIVCLRLMIYEMKWRLAIYKSRKLVTSAEFMK